MNTIATPTTAPAPLLRVLALLQRMRTAFPQLDISLSLLWDWTLEHLGVQRQWAEEARAIDDEMERVAPELWQCLQNDPPAKRARIWKAWQTTQARTETHAQNLTPPQLPG